jgi:toxin YoeB
MAKEIRWSLRADQDRLDILEYWTNRNRSTAYSIKLDKLFRASLVQIVEHPESGKPTNFQFVRIKIVRDYLIYYQITPDHIEIITIWDSRRNPKKFRL